MRKTLGSYDEWLLKDIDTPYGLFAGFATRRQRLALLRMERVGLVERTGYFRNTWNITQAGLDALDAKEYPDA